jgi:malate dehydrogenase
MMHIGIIGASGKVGRQALQYLYMRNKIEGLRLTLVSRKPSKDKGLLLDIRNTLPLKSANENDCFHEIEVVATDNYTDLSNASAIVIAAGVWPTKEQMDEFEQIDSTGRMVQSFVNYNVVADIGKQIARHAPGALVFVVTNQSDLMAEVAREYLPREHVLGVGGMIDSARFRMLLSDQLCDGVINSSFGYARERGHVIGYHNNDMIPLASSLTDRNIGKDKLDYALTETRKSGGYIAQLQRDPVMFSMATGASILPGYAAYMTLAAFTGQITPIEEAFNVVLEDASLAAKYGVAKGAALSVPVRLGKGRFQIASNYPVTAEERAHLAVAHAGMTEGYAKLVETIAAAGGRSPSTLAPLMPGAASS